jgi:preprotein translocase subunit YajC
MSFLLGTLYVLALMATIIVLQRRQQKKINQQIADHIEDMKKEQVEN